MLYGPDPQKPTALGWDLFPGICLLGWLDRDSVTKSSSGWLPSVTIPTAHPERNALRWLMLVVLAVAHAMMAVGIPLPQSVSGPIDDEKTGLCRLRRCGCTIERIQRGDCCCTQPARLRTRTCCDTTPAEVVRAARSTHGDCCQKPTSKFQWVLACEAAQCHGQGPLGLVTHPPLANEYIPIVTVQRVTPPEHHPIADEVSESVVIDLFTPPPRFLVTL